MESKYLKWIGGGLGWVVGGPIGAILGFALGSMVDTTAVVRGGQPFSGRSARVQSTTTNDFIISLLVLSAAIMKADGKVLKSELEYVRNFFTQQFGARRAQEQMLLLREILKQPLQLREVCEQIRSNMQHPLRLQLIHYVFGLAKADGAIDSSELRTIEDIAKYLGISQKDFESIKGMFGQDTGSAYKVLEITEKASDDEVKKAYRRMAVKFHPDKLSGMDENIKQGGEEKFVKVQEAYETIKKQRGLA